MKPFPAAPPESSFWAKDDERVIPEPNVVSCLHSSILEKTPPKTNKWNPRISRRMDGSDVFVSFQKGDIFSCNFFFRGTEYSS